MRPDRRSLESAPYDRPVAVAVRLSSGAVLVEPLARTATLRGDMWFGDGEVVYFKDALRGWSDEEGPVHLLYWTEPARR
jgi:hypothetical protein